MDQYELLLLLLFYLHGLSSIFNFERFDGSSSISTPVNDHAQCTKSLAAMLCFRLRMLRHFECILIL